MSVDKVALDELIQALNEQMQKTFSKQLNLANVEYAFKGIVVQIDTTNNTAIVDIGTSTTDYLPNKTGYDVGTEDTNLKVGDTVKVFSDRTNMVNAYIGVKL